MTAVPHICDGLWRLTSLAEAAVDCVEAPVLHYRSQKCKPLRSW